MRIAATSMTPIQVIESFHTKLQSIGISSFMQINFESTNSKVICESESDACPQRASESGKRLRRVTGGALSARRRLWRLANTQRCCSSERLRIGRKGESSGRPSWVHAKMVFRRGDRRAMAVRALLSKGDMALCRSARSIEQYAISALRALFMYGGSYTSPKSKSERPDVTDVKEKASSAYEAFFMGTSESLA